ncbi:MAG: YggS family pyridoxal phosphate-dependent enzyme [Planctomycetaceae bacterium]
MKPSGIAENLDRIRDRIAAACARSGRPVSSVRLVAVTKYATLEQVRALFDLGVRDLGESRPQQLLERAAQLPPDVRWHLIGHLQRNKARRLLPVTDCIHSVDSFRLLEALERLAEETATAPRVLLQVNVAGEAAKHGFDPEELARGWLEAVRDCRHVRLEGLMTMAPYAEDPEAARPVFRALRELRDRLVSDREFGSDPVARYRESTLPELSMGMTGDFEPAIEEGATLIRIGGALFDAG